MSVFVPEVALQNLLTTSLSSLKSDRVLVEHLFSQYSPAEVKEFVAFFSKEDILVRLGKPPRGPDFKAPMVVIESVSEDEIAEQDLLGDFQESMYDGFISEIFQGMRLRSTHNIICIAKDNRQARLLYRTVLSMLVLYRDDLEAAGFQNRKITGNKDVVVELGADFLEGKLMSITGEYWFSVSRPERLPVVTLSATVAATSPVAD